MPTRAPSLREAPPRRRAAGRASHGLALVLGALGCAAPPPPPPPAPLVGPLTVTTSRWTGGVLSGPRALAELDAPTAGAPAPTETPPTETPPTGMPVAESSATEPPTAKWPAERPAGEDAAAPRARRVRITVDALDRPLLGGDPIALRAAIVANVAGAIALSVENPLLLEGRVATGGEAVLWQRALAGLGDAALEGAGPLGRARLHTCEELVLPGATVVLSIGAVDVERPRGAAADGQPETGAPALGPYPQRLDVLVGWGAERLDLGVAVQTRDLRARPQGQGEPQGQDEVGESGAQAADPRGAQAASPERATARTSEGRDARRGAAGEDSPARSLPVGPRELRRDVALLRGGPVEGGAPVAVLVPSPLTAGAAPWLLVLVEGLDATPSDDELAAAAASLAAADTLHAAVADAPNERRIAEANALVAIASGEGRRTALLVLADSRGATLAADLALVLDDDGLAEYAARVGAARVAPGPDIGWQLEREALHHAAAALAGDGPPLALAGVLVQRAGQAGRYAAALEEAAAAPSLAAAEELIAAENRIHLDDADPAARVRAHRWLAERGAAPADYDPLGAADARRAALRAAREATGAPR